MQQAHKKLVKISTNNRSSLSKNNKRLKISTEIKNLSKNKKPNNYVEKFFERRYQIQMKVREKIFRQGRDCDKISENRKLDRNRFQQHSYHLQKYREQKSCDRSNFKYSNKNNQQRQSNYWDPGYQQIKDQQQKERKLRTVFQENHLIQDRNNWHEQKQEYNHLNKKFFNMNVNKSNKKTFSNQIEAFQDSISEISVLDQYIKQKSLDIQKLKNIFPKKPPSYFQKIHQNDIPSYFPHFTNKQNPQNQCHNQIHIKKFLKRPQQQKAIKNKYSPSLNHPKIRNQQFFNEKNTLNLKLQTQNMLRNRSKGFLNPINQQMRIKLAILIENQKRNCKNIIQKKSQQSLNLNRNYNSYFDTSSERIQSSNHQQSDQEISSHWISFENNLYQNQEQSQIDSQINLSKISKQLLRNEQVISYNLQQSKSNQSKSYQQKQLYEQQQKLKQKQKLQIRRQGKIQQSSQKQQKILYNQEQHSQTICTICQAGIDNNLWASAQFYQQFKKLQNNEKQQQEWVCDMQNNSSELQQQNQPLQNQKQIRPIILPCGHSFHKNCLQQWSKYKTICPLCKIKYEFQDAENNQDDEHGHNFDDQDGSYDDDDYQDSYVGHQDMEQSDVLWDTDSQSDDQQENMGQWQQLDTNRQQNEYNYIRNLQQSQNNISNNSISEKSSNTLEQQHNLNRYFTKRQNETQKNLQQYKKTMINYSNIEYSWQLQQRTSNSWILQSYPQNISTICQYGQNQIEKSKNTNKINNLQLFKNCIKKDEKYEKHKNYYNFDPDQQNWSYCDESEFVFGFIDID